MASPPFLLSGCASLSIDGNFFSALYINPYSFSPHEYRYLKHCVFIWCTSQEGVEGLPGTFISIAPAFLFPSAIIGSS